MHVICSRRLGSIKDPPTVSACRVLVAKRTVAPFVSAEGTAEGYAVPDHGLISPFGLAWY